MIKLLINLNEDFLKGSEEPNFVCSILPYQIVVRMRGENQLIVARPWVLADPIFDQGILPKKELRLINYFFKSWAMVILHDWLQELNEPNGSIVLGAFLLIYCITSKAVVGCFVAEHCP